MDDVKKLSLACQYEIHLVCAPVTELFLQNNLFQPPQLWMEREAQRQRQLESAFERLLLQTNAAPSHHHSSIPNTSPSPPPPPKSPRTPPPSPHAYPPPSPHSPPVPPHQPSSDDTLTSSTSSKFTDNGKFKMHQNQLCYDAHYRSRSTTATNNDQNTAESMAGPTDR